MIDSASHKAKRYAEQRKRRTEQLQAWEIKQLNRQIRDPAYREQLATTIIRKGVV